MDALDRSGANPNGMWSCWRFDEFFFENKILQTDKHSCVRRELTRGIYLFLLELLSVNTSRNKMHMFQKAL